MNSKTIVILVVLLAFAGVGYFLASKLGGAEAAAGEYNTFAQCLTEKGMVMYGSATCHFCAQQRAMFKSSFDHITEIECDPRNPDPEAERCIAKNIEQTPTWILEDADGNTITDLGSGVQSFETLSEAAGCPLEKDAVSQNG